jgi:hypothetical protein
MAARATQKVSMHREIGVRDASHGRETLAAANFACAANFIFAASLTAGTSKTFNQGGAGSNSPPLAAEEHIDCAVTLRSRSR